MTMSEEEDEFEDAMSGFYDAHDREPYSSHELSVWYAKHIVSQAAQIRSQLEHQGLRVTADGRIVPKTNEKEIE
jgi:hypothetical protein